MGPIGSQSSPFPCTPLLNSGKTAVLRSLAVNSRGIRGVSPVEEREDYGGKDLQKGKVLNTHGE